MLLTVSKAQTHDLFNMSAHMLRHINTQADVFDTVCSDWLLSLSLPDCCLGTDRKTFDGTVSRFMTGSGKRMVAYRRADGNLVHIAPEPDE